jgi:hypothetical protein
MKNLYFLFSLFLSLHVFAQAPEGINYQMVVRNFNNSLVSNSSMAIRVQVRQTSATGTIVYQEQHIVTSNPQGIVNLVIGNGTAQVGTFATISWGNGPYFAAFGIDFDGNTGGLVFQNYGSQQLMSVPYALYAKSSGATLNQWQYGTAPPTSSSGVTGNYFYDTSNGNIYYKQNGTTWLLVGNIMGPVGATGPAGPTGVTGTQGPQGIAGVTGPTGAQGPQGIAGPQGQAGVNGLNGTNGTNGFNTLVATTTIGSSVQCATGGVKLEYGLDINNNGLLDASEITASLTNYVCNGTVGATGPQGSIGLTGPQGPIGLTGAIGATGPQGPIGLTGATGAQGPIGSTGPVGANGTNGLNALIKTTAEPAGSNCTNGGTKIETGLDVNGNGVLDASEINASQTQYVCNGLNNNSSSNSNNSTFSMRLGFSTNSVWICPSGITKIKIELWGAGGGGAGGSGGNTNNGCSYWIGMGYVGANGGSGGSGGYNCSVLDVIPGNSYNIVIGQGGQGGNPNFCGFGQNGTIGGVTSFGNLLTAPGGNGGNGGNSYTSIQGAGGTSGIITNWFYPSSIPLQTYIPTSLLTEIPSLSSGGNGGSRGTCCGNIGTSAPSNGGNGQNGFCIISF